MFARQTMTATALIGALTLAGCAGDGGLPMTTGSLNGQTQTAAAKKAAVSPTCVALIARIDALRQEGTPARIKKVAQGKSKTVVVKRAALGKVAELDRANAEYQANCSTFAPSKLRAAVKRKKVTTTATAPTPKKKAAAPVTTTKKKTTAPATTAVRKKAAPATVKKATAPTAPVTTVKKKATVITKKATAVPAATTAAKKAAAPVTTGTVRSATTTAGSATTTVKKAATAVTSSTQTAAAKAKAAAAAAATATTAEATAPASAFPPAGTQGIPMGADSGVVVTTTP